MVALVLSIVSPALLAARDAIAVLLAGAGISVS